MSNRPILEERLVKLAAAGLGEGRERRLRAARADVLLRAVLVELDTIVLPRELRLRNGSGGAIAIEAAERRILALRAFDSAGNPNAQKPVSSEDAEAIRNSLLDLVGETSELFLSWSPLGRDFDPAEPGISAIILAEAWGTMLASPAAREAGDVIDRFLSRAQDSILAWVMISGGVSESFGDESRTDLLTDLAEQPDGRLALGEDGVSAEPWQFVVLGQDPAAGARGLIDIGGTRLAMVLAPQSIGSVTDLWRDALST